MKVTVKELDAYLSCAAPRTLSESWDNDGILLCRDENKAVEKVLVMLDVTDEGIEKAESGGFDVIVTHHPFIFHPLASLAGTAYGRFERLMRADVAVLSYHTRLDAAEGGVNDAGAAALRLTEVRPFGGETGCLGRMGKLSVPMAAGEFPAYLTQKLGCPGVRYEADESRMIEKVAFIGGAGKSFVAEAAAAGADAFVSSEFSHDSFYTARSLGLAVFDCGHYYTENPVCARLAALLRERFGEALTVGVFDTGAPYKG